MISLPGLVRQPVDDPVDDHGNPARTADDGLRPDGLPQLAVGDVATQALLAVWEGRPATVVASPPGAGKSTLLATCAAHLSVRAGLRVAVACQRNAQAVELANKVATIAPGAEPTLVASSKASRPANLHHAVQFENSLTAAGTGIVVATSAKLEWADPSKLDIDVLLVDEAWQLTWGSFGALSGVAPQFLLVGDPGQIAPVVTGDTRRWRGRRTAPQLPAPEVLSHLRPDDVTLLTLPNTRRCGPATAHVIQPLYDFAFGSARHPRVLRVDGRDQPEFSVLAVDGHGGADDPAVADAVAGRVRDLLARATVIDETGDEAPLRPADVGVVVAHNAQVTAVKARLADLRDVTVGTADSLQGAEFVAVIAWSPMAGKRVLSEFDVDTGRMCVALSRHVTHCTWVERTDTRDLFDASRDAVAASAWETAREVLDRLDAAADAPPRVTSADARAHAAGRAPVPVA